MNYYRPGGLKMLPPVVKNLLIINGLLFLALVSLQKAYQIDLNDILGMHYLGAEKFKPYQIITYMFMHGGVTHIFFNMFALWMFGKLLENYWGSKRFLVYYIITGIGAIVVHSIVLYFELSPTLNAIDVYISDPSIEKFESFINSSNFQVVSYDIQNHYNTFAGKFNNLLNIDSERALAASIDYIYQYRIDYLNAPVVVGASGAVFGILLAFGMLFPNSVIYLYFAIPLKAKYFVMIYGAIELYLGVRGGDNVAHFAHLGGMIFGFILIRLWKKNNPPGQIF